MWKITKDCHEFAFVLHGLTTWLLDYMARCDGVAHTIGTVTDSGVPYVFLVRQTPLAYVGGTPGERLCAVVYNSYDTGHSRPGRSDRSGRGVGMPLRVWRAETGTQLDEPCREMVGSWQWALHAAGARHLLRYDH
jgi:hypothetical protein